MLIVSFCTPRNVRHLAMLGCIGALALTIATLLIGHEAKGARRWLALPFLGTLQPSEFLKPCFAVVVAWLLTRGKDAAAERAATPRRGWVILHGQILWPLAATILLVLVGAVLKLQPDLGMLLVIAGVFVAQTFVAGLHILIVGVVGLAAVAAGVLAYFVLPHVKSRIDRFFDSGTGDHFQITKALEAFGNGGLFGRGPGEGRVKNSLPDAHADFVFAVAGEEYGFAVCLVILLLFGFIVVRGLLRLLGERDLFVVLAATGLLAQFGLQAFVNMASSLKLIPTKGMTLPLVSYGGSSVLAIALGMGMLLALTRRRPARAEATGQSDPWS
jgi:cell division protein FtsW